MVLYKVVNVESDHNDPMFNAFPMRRGAGPTLSAVKQNCAALHSLNPMGPEGYHWRVCVEDRPPAGSSERTFSWWYIQDERARLPVKEAYQSELAQFFAPPRPVQTSADSAAKVAKGAFKSLGKAMSSAVVGAADGIENQGPVVNVVAFKLIDMIKLQDDFHQKHRGSSRRVSTASSVGTPLSSIRSMHPSAAPSSQRGATPPSATHAQQRVPAYSPAPLRVPATHKPRVSQPGVAAHRPVPPPRAPPGQDASLLDFGASSGAGARTANHLHHVSSSPALFQAGAAAAPPPPPSNETRAQKLKREYEQKKKKSNRVWDEIDERWVEVQPGAAATRGTTSAPPGASTPANQSQKPVKKEVGIKLDPSSAVGKSKNVQDAVNKRVNDMQKSQQKAVEEIRHREAAKKSDDAEEDTARKQLEPRIKAWSEEHGKKKQLRALLASLHTILWPDAKWTPITLGDILDDSKCKRAFHKASRVVHPDKTSSLDAPKRFLAKRIFDALSQAKAAMDNN